MSVPICQRSSLGRLNSYSGTGSRPGADAKKTASGFGGVMHEDTVPHKVHRGKCLRLEVASGVPSSRARPGS